MARTTRILRSPRTPQASVRVAYASLWLRATKMARLGTPYYRAMREENSCQCQVCLTRTKRIGCRDCAIHRYTDADGCLGHEIATKGPFIATQLDVELSWVELSWVASLQTPSPTQFNCRRRSAMQLTQRTANQREVGQSSCVELRRRRYRHFAAQLNSTQLDV